MKGQNRIFLKKMDRGLLVLEKAAKGLSDRV